jgi:hypothetical protein
MESCFLFSLFFLTFLLSCKNPIENYRRMRSASIWDVLHSPQFMGTVSVPLPVLPACTIPEPTETATPAGECATSSALEGTT